MFVYVLKESDFMTIPIKTRYKLLPFPTSQPPFYSSHLSLM